MRSSTLNAILILLMCAIWAGNYFVIKAALAYVDPVTFSFLRAILGGCFVVILGGYSVRSFKRRDILWLALLGLFNVTLFVLLLNASLETVAPGVDSTLVYTEPIMVVAMATLLGERLTPRRLGGVLAAFGGIVVIFLPAILTASLVVGDIYALGSAFSWGLAVIIFKKWGSPVDSRTITAFQSIMGGVFMIPAFAFVKPFLDPTIPFWIFLLYNILLASSVTYIIYMKMLTRMPASQFSTYFFLVPVMATIMASVLQMSLPPWNEVAGTVLVALGIVMVNR